MVQLTEKAITKVREILDTQDPKPAGLRIAVVGGGCSGSAIRWPSKTARMCSTRLTVSMD